MRTITTLLLLMFVLPLSVTQGQQKQNSYRKLSSLFNSYDENDERALVFVNKYIGKAKSEKNVLKLIAGYEEAIYYSSNPQRKLLYADSAIRVALHSKNPDQISRAYLGKGIIYYYNTGNIKKALGEYLIAFRYSKHSEDGYLRNKIVYHLGIVKCYLGYYSESVQHFTETAGFFEKNMKAPGIHDNIRLNHESGYFNSIYRLSTSYSNMGMYKKEDSLIDLGLNLIVNDNKHPIEYAYFQRGRGIQLLRQEQPREALKHFMLSRDILIHKQDFASLAGVDFYVGKLYWHSGNRRRSLFYLKKADSIANKYRLITPEIRSTYEYLINDAKQNHNDSGQLYYTNQLLRADSVITADFAGLSSKIKHEYDTDRLTDEKELLVRKQKRSDVLWIVSLFSTAGLILFLICRFRRKEKRLTARYDRLIENMHKKKGENTSEPIKPARDFTRSSYSMEQIEEVKNKLKVFEEKKQFLKKNLKLPDVAALIGTNRTTLSYVLNDHLGITFPDYLKRLRINYIAGLMLEDKKYLNFTMDGLAEKCGMSNRQVFSTHFLEITGMRPIDFIRKRLEQLEKN